MMPVVKRHSLLKRHPALTRADFAQHYRYVHGSLAAAQSGFRLFAYRYVQNHVEEALAGDSEPPFDGITVTYQAPRADYRRGFFQHPDYANVRPDEERLFDVAGTLSVLGEQHVLLQGRAAGGFKAVILSRAGGRSVSPDELIGIAPSHGIETVVRNDLDADTSSDLGATGHVGFPYGRLWEIWFTTAETRRAACGDAAVMNLLAGEAEPAPVAMAVHEVVIYSGPRPPHAATGAT